MSHTHEYHTHDYLPDVSYNGLGFVVFFIVIAIAAAMCWFPWDNTTRRRYRIVYDCDYPEDNQV